MDKYIKIIISNFVELEIDKDSFENQLELEENIDNVENIKKQKINLYWFYILGIISLFGLGIYLYSNHIDWFNASEYINKIGHLKELDEIGNTLYKLSAELSNSSTVRSWEVIHKVLKDLEKESINGLELIAELEKLKKINRVFPGQFSTNPDSFEKSLIKLINFLKEII